ncbi:lipase maturation factor-domain-containing protein [Tribonema minus]|uniref:Lipase maturation factor-domain-containing protein n=1 Tax=Tribonema minus TaxID=303371 RepID=A0A835ZBY7_9STRA|nr:lipase maturation factor-domain-containing protein [Tribonema minus]
MLSGQHQLVRTAFVRAVGLLYGLAFLAALRQNEALLGPEGLLPATAALDRAAQLPLQPWQRWLQLPTLFWLVTPTNAALSIVAALGLGFSYAIVVCGAANAPTMACLWFLYLSIVNLGQAWYGFGWDSALLELGFLSMLLVPTLRYKRCEPAHPPPPICVWGFRWFLTRVLLTRALLTLRSSCWRDASACAAELQLDQLPATPAGWHVHGSAPHWLLACFVVFVLGAQLLAPVLMLLGRTARCWAGIAAALALLIGGGGPVGARSEGFAAAAACVWCFDDAHLSWLFGERDVEAAIAAAGRQQRSARGAGRWVRRLAHAAALYAVARSSWDVVSRDARLPSNSAQSTRCDIALNTFLWTRCHVSAHARITASLCSLLRRALPLAALRVVGSYAAVQTRTGQRMEIVLSAAGDDDAQWHELDFRCKGSSSYSAHPWLVHLAAKLLDPAQKGVARALVVSRPPNSEPPLPPLRRVKADLYRYRFVASAADGTEQAGGDDAGAVSEGGAWVREYARPYMPPVTAGSAALERFLELHGLG